MMQRWREGFAQDPDRAVADLFSGRASLGAAFRRDVPEILFHEFPDRPDFTFDRERLDDALLGWLNNMRTNYRRQVDRLDYGVYSLRLCEALRALQLLNLPRSIHHIREVHAAWLRWLNPLRLAPERDPALESWRLLTLRQPADGTPAPWLTLAVNTRPEYLTVALVGLQRLPLSELKQNQTLMLAALLQHCAASGTAGQGTAEFKRQFAALRGRYPRSPEHWQGLLDTAIDAAERHKPPPRLAKLIEGLHRGEVPRRQATPPAITNLPSREENSTLLVDIKNNRQPSASVAKRFVAIIDRYLHHAQQTGDAYFFVRSLCNHGKHLLKRRDLPTDLFVRLSIWIEEAQRWEPQNEHIWTFWADCLAWQGREEQQGWVLREAARLFPDNEPSRVELARLLLRRGEAHWPEAERWLHEVIERHPDNTYGRVELARLLMRRGEAHWPEAECWLREVVERHPDSEHSRVELARLLMRRGEAHWPEAECWLREVVEHHPDSERSRVELARLLMRRGEAHWPEAECWLREVVERHPDSEHSRVELARLLMRRGEAHWPEAECWLREVVKRHPDNEHARILLDELPSATEHAANGITPEAANSGMLAEPKSTTAPTHVPDATSTISGPLAHLRDRAEAQTRFAAARHGSNPAGARERLKADANAGDTLAGFYAIWLGETADLMPPPPNAWAWHVAHCFHSMDQGAWRRVKEQFGDRFDLNLYLHWLADPGAQGGQLAATLEDRFAGLSEGDEAASSPARRFAVTSWRRLQASANPDGESRESIALSLLQAEAEPSSAC